LNALLPCCSDADGSRADRIRMPPTSLPSASIRINYSGLTTTSPLPNPNNPIAQQKLSWQSRAGSEGGGELSREGRMAAEQGRSLAETPTWSVATVTTLMVAACFLVERSLSRFAKVTTRAIFSPLTTALVCCCSLSC
jgi:hypothetical protein